ncbi:hypothetical protein [Hyalangium rubrum]|uniref:Lipoprotein n=1 Tax=Hyalangium rubrum TaxID=3103134 RepID=A0ABU5HHN2_9BACT|nr:hypothetical protein [Hyalangium sp. s54d21]MDY7232657.1 hypothetical protein [Hyalangium sp. s54d21]
MRITVIKLAWVIPWLMIACTGTLFSGNKEAAYIGVAESERMSEDTQQSPLAVLEVHNSQYDGRILSGRLLVGSLVDGLRLDKRLDSGADINVDSVADCATGQLVSFVTMDGFRPAAREEERLILNSGYWYGTQMHFLLFTKPGPECIQAEVSLLSFEGKRIAHVEVRAERAPLQSVDAGTSEGPQPSTDAGMP